MTPHEAPSTGRDASNMLQTRKPGKKKFCTGSVQTVQSEKPSAVIPDERLQAARPGIHTPGLWLWIPGSRASLVPRNDGREVSGGPWFETLPSCFETPR